MTRQLIRLSQRAPTVPGLCLMLVLLACAAPSPPARSPSGLEGSTTSMAAVTPAAKSVTIALLLDPLHIRHSQATILGELVTAGMAVEVPSGYRYAQLAEALPSPENGTWQVFPDGQMETTWRLREGARWHDGQPLTADDLLFTATVVQDRELTFLREPAMDLTESIEARDERTVVVRWKQPYIDADLLFTNPMPRHLLESAYLQSPSQFEALPYWTTEYVGAGPFRMREWVRSSHARLEAFESYVQGRPKVDQIEVRFITDANTLVANVLAGEVDITAPRALSIEQGLSIRDRWPEGKMLPYVQGWTMMYPQLYRPNPPVIGDPRFRRALVHAVNRQELAETLTAGFAPVAHSIIPPDHPSYSAVESHIVRYDFDPRRTGQLIGEMGLSRGSDGVFRDRNGEALAVNIQTTVNDTNQKTAFATANFWQQIGIAGEVKTIPPSRVGIWQERYSYDGFDLVNQPHGTRGIRKLLHSSAAPLPERGYTAPNAPANRGSYVNPEYDQLLDRYLATIPMPERLQLLAELVRRQTDEQLVIGFFHSVNAVVMANRILNATPGTSWNAHQWDVR